MRIDNMHHFTENHRFTVYRDFSLSSLDYRVLASLYQPMIGTRAIGVYQTLYHQLAVDQVGYSPLEQQRRLFYQLEWEPNEQGRKRFIEQTSLLEAVGLLQSHRRYLAETDDYIFEYRLLAPLTPAEFFKTHHLTILLRDKVGKYMVLLLKNEFLAPEPVELSQAPVENLSVPFYEWFRLNTSVIDLELEQAFEEVAATARPAPDQALDVTSNGFHYTDLLLRYPKGGKHRKFIEELRVRSDQLTAINMTAKKYGLTLQETCRLLDEDGMFDEWGELQYELLQYRASLLYRQGKRRLEAVQRKIRKLEGQRGTETARQEAKDLPEEKPVEMDYYLEVPPLLKDQMDIHQYNLMLRNEPYTRVLKRFFPQGTVPDGVLDIFEKIDLNYGLAGEVINVLIHFIHTDRRSWTKSSIEAVASDMLGKLIGTYEQAVEYVRERERYKNRAAVRKEAKEPARRTEPRSGTKTRTKPQIPLAEHPGHARKLTEEEMEAIIRKASMWEEGGN